jgi:hypothetical protein
MTRISAAETLAALNQEVAPKLVIIGHSISGKGRTSTMLRVRPTVMARLERVAVGPTYLLCEIALLEMIDRLEKAQPGELRVVRAETFNPSKEDLEMIAAAEDRKLENPRFKSSRKKRAPGDEPETAK